MVKVFNINGVERIPIMDYFKKLNEVFTPDDLVYVLGGIFDIPPGHFMQTMNLISQRNAVILKDYKSYSIECGQREAMQKWRNFAEANIDKKKEIEEYLKMIERNISNINDSMNKKFMEYAGVFSMVNIEPGSKEADKRKKIQEKLFSDSKKYVRHYSNRIEYLITNGLPKEQAEERKSIPELEGFYSDFDYYKNKREPEKENIYLVRFIDGELDTLKSCEPHLFMKEYGRETQYKQSLTPMKMIIPGKETSYNIGMIIVGEGEVITL